MKASVILAVLPITLTIVVCTKTQTAYDDSNSPVFRFAQVLFQFTSDFLCELINTNPNKNVNGSPLAFLYEVALLYLFSCGKTENGLRRALNCLSKKQILDVLIQISDAETANTKGVTHIVNGTVIVGSTEIEFTDYFNKVVSQVVLGTTLNVDYQKPAEAVKIANNVIAERTNGKVTNVVTDTDTFTELCQLIRLSGLYFQLLAVPRGFIRVNYLLFYKNRTFSKDSFTVQYIQSQHKLKYLYRDRAHAFFIVSGQFRYGFNDDPQPGYFYGAFGKEEANYVFQTETYRYGDSKMLNSEILQVEYLNGYSVFFIKPNQGANICSIMKKLRSLNFVIPIFLNLEETSVRFGFSLYDNVTTSIDSEEMFRKYLSIDSALGKGAQFENITKNNECVYFGNGLQKFVFQSDIRGGPSQGIPKASKVIDFILDSPYFYFVTVNVEVNAEVESLNLPLIAGYRAIV